MTALQLKHNLNKQFGFRNDLDRPFKWYLNQFIRKHIFWRLFYISEDKTYKDYTFKLFPYKWLGIRFSLKISTAIFKCYAIRMNLEKFNWQIEFTLQNNTA